MKYILTVLVALMLSFSASAQVVDVSKLTTEQQAYLKSIAAPTAPPIDVQVDNALTRIEQFGTASAKGLTSFAKELGVVAADFADTTLGKMVVVGLVVYYAGGSVIDFMVGVVFLFVIMPTLVYHLIKVYRPIPVEFKEVPILWGLWTKRVPTQYEDPTREMTDATVMYVFILIVATIISLIVGLNFI